MNKISTIIDTRQYQQWLDGLIAEIDRHRLKAAMDLNAAALQHYWWLGKGILNKQQEQGWGAKVVDMLADDLQKRYGKDSGYSVRNLKYMRQFASEYPDFPFVQVPLAQLEQSPILQALAIIHGVSRWSICASAACTNHLVSSHISSV